MSLKRVLASLTLLVLGLLGSTAALAQVAPVAPLSQSKEEPQENREPYRSQIKDRKPGGGTEGEHEPQGDDPMGHIEWMRARMGGDLTPDFMKRLFIEAAGEREKYPSNFQSNDKFRLPVVVGTTWAPLGPTSSNKIQNGITLTKVNSGRLRTILLDTVDPETVYILSAGGGRWKSRSHPTASN